MSVYGENPYAYNDATGRNYVGNGDLLRRVITGMIDHGEHFAIVGGRRCGKTSTLHVLEEHLAQGEHGDSPRHIVPLLIDASAGPVSPAILFREILRSLTKRIEEISESHWDSIAHEEEPYRAFRQKLTDDSIRTALTRGYGRNWLGVIMLDEIDDIAQRLLETGHGDVFFRNLRYLVMEETKLKGHFRLVAAGVNDLTGLIRSGSPLNMMATKELGVLQDEDVAQLADVGFRGSMTDAANERLTELTGRHPYLLQGVLQTLWPPGRVGIAGGQVAQAADQFQREHEHDFSNWLSVFDSTARMVYGYLSASLGESASLSKLVRAFPAQEGMSVSGRDVERALGVLATHGVIVADADGENYRVSGTMFRDWFHSHAPVAKDAVVEILDRLAEHIDGLRLSRRERHDAEDLLAKTRDVFSGGGDPGEIKGQGAEAFRKVWEVVKGVKDAATLVDMAVKLAPHLGTAAAWILKVGGL